jgi:hypothetical protein
MRSWIKLALMMLVVTGVQAQQHAPRDPMVEANATRKLTTHVYAIEDKDTTPGVPNIGFVVGTRAALVIDTGMGDRNGRTVLAEVEKIAPGKALYLVTTHVHPELEGYRRVWIPAGRGVYEAVGGECGAAEGCEVPQSGYHLR